MNNQIIRNKRSTGKRKKFLTGIKKFLKGMAVVIAVILIMGFAYEKFGQYSDSKKYKPVGKIINVDGHNMHIFAKGKGDATVVFSSGWGTPSPYADFYPLYNEISKHTRVAVYDRPGYGWSDVSKTPRDIDTITKEMHELLVKSGEKAPYILVGHSLGSLEVVRFAQMYKDEVKGIVMIEGGNPEYYSNEKQEDVNDVLISSLSKSGAFRVLFNIPSLASSINAPRNNLALVPKDLKELDKAMYLKNMTNKNKNDELKNAKNNATEVVSNGKLGSIPLRILTSESEANGELKWKQSQQAFKNWSTDSKQIIVPGAGHFIHQYKPELINEQILGILNK
ncbi:alpha/beta hydrolase [Clostridium carboxidivorans P7]|uniref:alpha/beta fold hydrolase n=1 Tax=Clostridium carboxidivorans TaxID=217159 RepID=UPI00064F2AD2|nr:alpha/beta hydrolase [Clostridium carboxidivorans]AKN30206.1 alpha/beta hydrolase [Clostridium carboxidivorans P7]